MNILLFEEAELGRPLQARDPRAIHLLKVLRKKTTGEFDAGLIGGKRGKGTITRIDSTDGSLSFSLQLDEAPPPRLPIETAVGFPRPIQLRRILRELSTMGVAAISVFATDLGEKSYRDTKLFEDGGAAAALLEGAIQARDTLLPTLRVFPSAASWLDAVPAVSLPSPAVRVFADNLTPQGNFADLPSGQNSFIIAIGSERGWSDQERTLFRAAGFTSLSLGERALRTETAVVAATAFATAKL